jgi:hypothetical protein
MTETLERELHAQLFDIRRSIRYHHRRCAFFDRLDRLTNMTSVIFGSAAVYGVLEQEYKVVALSAAASVTGLSAINLVLGSAQRARAHHDFARQFIELEKRLTLSEPEQSLLKEIIAARLTIEAEEPPVLHVLNVICHNEQLRAMGYPTEQLTEVSWYQRFFAQFTDVREDKLVSRSN